jgi:hypothetical protein
MFVMKKSQQAAFARAAADDFEDRMATHLRRVFPDDARTQRDQELRPLIRRGVARAARWGIELEFSICLHLHLMLHLGEAFDEDPALPWARAALEDRIWDPERRVSELHDRVFGADDPVDGEGKER